MRSQRNNILEPKRRGAYKAALGRHSPIHSASQAPGQYLKALGRSTNINILQVNIGAMSPECLVARRWIRKKTQHITSNLGEILTIPKLFSSPNSPSPNSSQISPLCHCSLYISFNLNVHQAVSRQRMHSTSSSSIKN